MRLLGEPPTLNTFKSFPDLEEAEYLVRHRPSGNIRGVQVKCLIVPDADYRGGVDFTARRSPPSPLTDFVILAWREDLGGFDDDAWIIPAIDIPRFVSTDGYTFRLPLRISKPSRDASTPTEWNACASRQLWNRGWLATGRSSPTRASTQ